MHENSAGNNPFSTCVICGLNKNIMSNRGQASGIKLLFGYHNNALFGISRFYSYISNIKYKWLCPTQSKKKNNSRVMRVIKEGM